MMKKFNGTTKFERWQEKYHHCLALEFSNPKYFKVHHLLVLTYMLQTNGYSDDYYTMAIHLLKSFLNNSITPQEFKEKYHSFETNQDNKNRLRNEDIEELEWNIDITDIRTDNEEQYCKDVVLWANDVLITLENSGLKNNIRNG